MAQFFFQRFKRLSVALLGFRDVASPRPDIDTSTGRGNLLQTRFNELFVSILIKICRVAGDCGQNLRRWRIFVRCKTASPTSKSSGLKKFLFPKSGGSAAMLFARIVNLLQVILKNKYRLYEITVGIWIPDISNILMVESHRDVKCSNIERHLNTRSPNIWKPTKMAAILDLLLNTKLFCPVFKWTYNTHNRLVY